MKRVLFISVFISVLYAANAQETEIDNKIILGGSFSFLSQDNTFPLTSVAINSGIGAIYSSVTNDARNTTFKFTPYIGKEIRPKLFVGFQFDYSRGRYKAEDTFVFGQTNSVDYERNSNQMGIGLFTRYILRPHNRFSFFIQPFMAYNLLDEEEVQDSNVTQEENTNYFEVGAGLGILYNLSDKIRAILRSGSLNYIKGKWEIKTPIRRKILARLEQI